MKNNMKVVGMGEALWDVLPEGKKIGAHPQILLTMYLNLGSTAAHAARSVMILLAKNLWRISIVRM